MRLLVAAAKKKPAADAAKAARHAHCIPVNVLHRNLLMRHSIARLFLRYAHMTKTPVS